MKSILIRVDDAVATALAERKELTLVPTEAFIRRAIERELRRPIVEVQPARAVPEIAAQVQAVTSSETVETGLERRSRSAEPVLMVRR